VRRFSEPQHGPAPIPIHYKLETSSLETSGARRGELLHFELTTRNPCRRMGFHRSSCANSATRELSRDRGHAQSQRMTTLGFKHPRNFALYT
jgi:hypothetical protein